MPGRRAAFAGIAAAASTLITINTPSQPAPRRRAFTPTNPWTIVASASSDRGASARAASCRPASAPELYVIGQASAPVTQREAATMINTITTTKIPAAAIPTGR